MFHLKQCPFLFVCLIYSCVAFGQKSLTLPQVIEMAQKQSPAYKQATTALNASYWEYRSFRSDYLPQLTLGGTLPELNRTIDRVPQPDGSEAFRRRSLATSSLDLSLSQNIGPTGGLIYLSSVISRIDLISSFSTGTQPKTSYQASPAILGFRQPIFRYNSFKWRARVSPLLYEESTRKFNEDMETISVTATNLFFDLLLAQISYDIARKNQSNTDTLFKIAQGRYELGKIAENDLLQLELSLMNAGQAVTRSSLDKETSSLRLKTYLGMSETETIMLVEPSATPQFEVDATLALEEARRNRQTVVSFQRRLLEAESNVARARGNKGLSVDVFAEFGLVKSATAVPDLYINPQDQQRVRIGFNIPLITWGRNKALVQTATANKELVETVVSQEKINFEQQVSLQANQFNLVRDQLAIGIKSDEIAQKRYEITKNRYVIGKIGITDLNIALQEKDQAKQAYVAALRSFWLGYYTLRLFTLYDFESRQPIRYSAR
jgi:outer membrane protein TolC